MAEDEEHETWRKKTVRVTEEGRREEGRERERAGEKGERERKRGIQELDKEDKQEKKGR